MNEQASEGPSPSGQVLEASVAKGPFWVAGQLAFWNTLQVC